MVMRLLSAGVLGVLLLCPAATVFAQRNDRDAVVEGTREVKTFTVGDAGTLRLSNVAGDVVVTGGGGGEIRIESVKHAKGRNDEEARRYLDAVQVAMQQVGSSVEVKTVHQRGARSWVDYTVTVPAGTALELRSVSGDVQVSNVKGVVRAESVSGDVIASGLARVAALKAVSGDVTLTDGSADVDVSFTSVSGDLTIKGFKGRNADVSTVSGDVMLSGCDCEGVQAQSVSGTIAFSGRLAPAGRYSFKSHSGDIEVATGEGFDLDASTFSGSIRSQVQLAVQTGSLEGGRGPGRAVRARVGKGGPYVEVKTFSGDIILSGGR